MLRFFRTSNTAVIVVVLLMGAVAWLHALGEMETAAPDPHDGILFQALSGGLSGSLALQAWLGLVLFLSTAILLIWVNARLRLIDQISYLPALCFVLLIGGVPEIHRFHPALVAVILLVAGFIELTKSFESERLSYGYFVAPVLISVASLFYQYAYAYMLVAWLAIMLWRPRYWREWVFSFLGFALPQAVAFSWFFLTDNYEKMDTFLDDMFHLAKAAPSLHVSTVIFASLSLVAAVVGVGYLLRYLRSKKNIIRNGYHILLLMAAVTVGMAVAAPCVMPFAWYLLAFPLSMMIANYLANTKSARWGNIVLLTLFVGVMVAQAVFLSAD